jgi:hypothetical protein
MLTLPEVAKLKAMNQWTSTILLRRVLQRERLRVELVLKVPAGRELADEVAEVVAGRWGVRRVERLPRAGRWGGSSAWQHGSLRPTCAAVGGEDKPWPTSHSSAIHSHRRRAPQGRGSRAPNFRLTRGDLSDISLADFEGTVKNIVPPSTPAWGRPRRAASIKEMRATSAPWLC